MKKSKSEVTSKAEDNKVDPSLIYNFYHELLNLPVEVRNDICRECGWSPPTFYRKISHGKISKAEYEKSSSLILSKLATIMTEIQTQKDNYPDMFPPD